MMKKSIILLFALIFSFLVGCSGKKEGENVMKKICFAAALLLLMFCFDVGRRV